MTNANYDRFFKFLGKLAYMYDNAGSSVTTQNQARYRTVEQAAKSDQEYVDLPEVDLLAGYVGSWKAAVSSGASQLQTLMVQIGQALVTSSDFTAAIITAGGLAALTNKSNAGVVITALAAEMTADSKTITTVGSTGLANFLNQVAGSTVATPQSGSPSYPDGTYVVLTIV